MRTIHPELHRTERIGWLRAAVLGANDGIVSTASLVLGVATAEASRSAVLVAGVAGLVAGAMSMAAGEYVSVSSQADTEQADLARERGELAGSPVTEHAELAAIYEQRGLTPRLAAEVAAQLMAHDALGAHARDELGISAALQARPVQAALTSALTFAVGAALPLLVASFSPTRWLVTLVAGASLVCLGLLGAVAARAGGARPWVGTLRVLFWGALAMGLTAAIGKLFLTNLPLELLLAWRLRRDREVAELHGLKVFVPHGANQELLVDRLRNAMALLASRAPRALRQVQSEILAIVVLPRRIRRGGSYSHRSSVVMLDQVVVWRWNLESVAVEIAGWASMRGHAALGLEENATESDESTVSCSRGSVLVVCSWGWKHQPPSYLNRRRGSKVTTGRRAEPPNTQCNRQAGRADLQDGRAVQIEAT